MCVLASLCWAGDGQRLGTAAGLMESHSMRGIDFGGWGCCPEAQASAGRTVGGIAGEEGQGVLSALQLSQSQEEPSSGTGGWQCRALAVCPAPALGAGLAMEQELPALGPEI